MNPSKTDLTKYKAEDTKQEVAAVLPVTIVAPRNSKVYILTDLILFYALWLPLTAWAVLAWLLPVLGLSLSFWEAYLALFALRLALTRYPNYQQIQPNLFSRKRVFLQ